MVELRGMLVEVGYSPTLVNWWARDPVMPWGSPSSLHNGRASMKDAPTTFKFGVMFPRTRAALRH